MNHAGNPNGTGILSDALWLSPCEGKFRKKILEKVSALDRVPPPQRGFPPDRRKPSGSSVPLRHRTASFPSQEGKGEIVSNRVKEKRDPFRAAGLACPAKSSAAAKA